ncbi:MAG: right-handed parallel beta-helix repeat-containing protein [Chloroflexota bacterium]
MVQTITVDGTLTAAGTADEAILFTSAQSTPAPAQWRKIVFNPLSTDNVLDHVTIEYGGYFQPMVDVRTDSLTISDTTIHDGAGIGMQLNDASPTISTTTFTDNGGRALELNGASFPTLSELSASGNGFDGVTVTGTTVTDDYTWGQAIDNYLVTGNVTVNPDTTLDIVPDTTVRFIGTNTSLIVDGTLTAVGTTDNPILFTSGQSTPAPGQWKQIVFNDDSQNSVLEYVTVEYGGYFDPVIVIGTSSATIRNSTITRSNDDGIEVSAGSPTITNNNIVANAEFGLRNTSTGTVGATCNWWGAASGPTNDANPGGLGQTVSDNVIFSPWLTAEAPNDTCQSGVGGDGRVVYLPLLIR